MNRYQISTGELSAEDGTLLGTGYSGLEECKNDPSKCAVHDRGPICPGFYTIEEPHDSPTHGPFAMHLTPDADNEMHGRGAFMVHGDSAAHPGKASNGCIVQGHDARVALWGTGDRRLQVVP